MTDDHGRVYLDHNATSPLRPEVAEAVRAMVGGGQGEDGPAPARLWGNPSSTHQDGRRARAALEDAREAVAGLVGAAPERVIFTSGGSEANALALFGLTRAGGEAALVGADPMAPPRPVIVGATEHPSVLNACPGAQRLPVDAVGRPDLDALDRMLEAGADRGRDGGRDGGAPPPVVALMLANNETGVVLPIAEAAARVAARGGLLHCDAVQGPGRLPVDRAALGCASLALSGHKLGAPAGIGALVLAPGVGLRPWLRGGGQERGRRAGTENLLGAVALGVAARVVAARGRAEAMRMQALRDDLERRLAAALGSRLVIYGQGVARLPNTSCLGLAGLAADRLVMALDLAGVRVSAGSACSSGLMAPSPVLRAMGVGEAEAAQAIRISLGPTTTPAEIDRCVALLCDRAGRILR